jgi:protein SCO1
VLAVAVLAGWPLVSGLLRRPPAVPEILGTLPPFSLVEPGGERVDRASLAGRLWLLGFVDTGCPACAERLGSGLERLQYRIRNVGQAVGILEVAIPSANTVVDVGSEMTRRHANPRQWRTASGPDARRLLGEVGALSLRAAPALEAGGAVVLVDAEGRVRAVEGVEAPESIDRLVSKTTLILNIR